MSIDINGLGITSDAQLSKICKDLGIDLKFIGFEEDLKKINNGSYILNIGNNRQGTHWVCCFCDKKELFYFDSFAVGPNDELIKLAKLHKLKLAWNNEEQFQMLDEKLCGVWCVYFLYHMTKGTGSLADRFKSFCDLFD